MSNTKTVHADTEEQKTSDIRTLILKSVIKTLSLVFVAAVTKTVTTFTDIALLTERGPS